MFKKILIVGIGGLLGLSALGAVIDAASGSDTAPAPKVDRNAPAPDVQATTASQPETPSTTDQAPATNQAPAMTVGQENAIESAKGYLDYGAFSRSGLIHQLSSNYGEGYSKADATFAVDHLNVNWNEQAAKSAEDYLSYDAFSRQGLIDQLSSKYGEGFTHAQAVYGVNQTGL
jgi:hypothetical protein